MSPGVKSFLVRWAITSVGVLVASKIVRGIRVDALDSLIVAALLLGFFNAVLRPIMMVLTFPLLIVTLGLFTFVINALMLALTAWLLPGFSVSGFWSAFIGSIVISIVSLIGNGLVGKEKKPQEPPRPANTPPSRPPVGEGPVIDV
ncbi:MAG TPA: phage holin family protein [Methylomirabilota bacterium]|nr:phage holin family protein [Methylomirabilota bacterium]